MKKVLIFMLLCFAGCSPRIQQSITHSEKTDSVTEYYPGDVVIPESDNSFDIDLTSFCKSFELENDSLRLALIKVITPGPSPNRPDASLKFIPKQNYKATIICHEDEWHRRYDSLRVNTVVTTTVKDSINNVVYQCDSSFHKFTVKFFYGVLALLTIGTFLFLRYKK